MSGELPDLKGADRLLTLPGMGPVPGDRYKNRHRNLYATIIGLRQRKHLWVVVRVNEGERELSLAELNEFWVLV